MNASGFYEDCVEVAVGSDWDGTVDGAIANFTCSNLTSSDYFPDAVANSTTPPLMAQKLNFINVTNQLAIDYALPMYGYMMPILLVVTIVANTLIMVVLSKRHMRTPTNLVLFSMALSDMFTLLVPAPWLFYMYTLGNHNKPLFPVTACYSYTIMQEVLPNLFHTASIWLTLTLALQRYIYVCLPPLARTWCTVPRVKRGIVWVYVLAAAHQSTRFADNVYFGIEVEWNGQLTWVCGYQLATWVEKWLTANVYFNFYYWFRILFVHCVPCALLVVLNVLLFGAMRRAQRKRERLFFQPPKDSSKASTNHKRSSECRKLRDSNCTTLMLIVVVSVFLCVEIPLAIITLLHALQNTFDLYLLDYKVANLLILFTNFFIMLSYPINFAIYCGMSRQFRETFKELFISGGSACGAGAGVGGASIVGGASCVDGRGCRDGSSRYSLVNGPRTNCTNETIL